MNFKRNKVSIAIGSLFVASAAMTSSSLYAQEATTERVTITGSAISRVSSETSLPVQVLSRDDIDRSGAQSAAELLQNLPSMQGFTAASESVGGGGSGWQPASLRTLGGDHTLVLLNGRRLAPWAGQTLTGYGDGVDLNLIPMAAIDRIEVLTDGASALYGTDAIAGVVNFITRKNFDKAEIFGNISRPDAGKGAGEQRISVTKGFGDLQKDGYNLLLAYNKYHKDELGALDRDFAKSGIVNFNDGGRRLQFANWSSRSIPANVRINGAMVNPYFVANGKCPPNHFSTIALGTQGCAYDYVTALQIVPEQNQENFFASFSKSITGGHTFYADYLHAEADLTSKIAPPPVDIPVRTTFPAYSVVAALGATGDVTARWRLMDAGNRTTLNETKADHLNFGIKGMLGSWDYDLAFTHSSNKTEERHLAGWLKSNELVAALQSGTLNPFVLPGQQSTAGLAAIKNAVNRGVYKAGETEINILSLTGSREAFSAPGGPAIFATGVDFRRESASYDPSAIAMGLGNSIAGDSASEVPFDASRKAWGVFAELQVPFAKNLEGNFALRHDNYSDFGGTTNAKASVRWQPVKTLMLRGSVGTGFKAPSVPQTTNVQQLYGVTGAPYSCPFAAGDPMAVYCVPGSTQYNVFAAGNPDLDPESSQQISFGFRFEPIKEVSAGVDYWKIKLKDRLGQIDESVIFDDPVAYRHLFTHYVDPTSGSDDLAVLLANSNLGNMKVSGLDFDISAKFRTPVGPFTSQLTWTHILESTYQRTRGGDWYSDLNKFNDGGVTFKDAFRWANTLTTGNFSHTLALNYKSGYKDQEYTYDDCAVEDLDLGDCAAVARNVKAYYTWDWQTRYNFNKDLRFTVGILNLFDKDPPVSIKSVGGHQIGYDNRYTDPRGRTFYLNASYRF